MFHVSVSGKKTLKPGAVKHLRASLRRRVAVTGTGSWRAEPMRSEVGGACGFALCSFS